MRQYKLVRAVFSYWQKEQTQPYLQVPFMVLTKDLIIPLTTVSLYLGMPLYKLQ